MQNWKALGLLLGLSAILFSLAVFIIRGARRETVGHEQRRRSTVNRHGRLGDALITEVSEHTIYYSYSLRGVVYTTSQDVTDLQHMLPDEPDRLVGPVSLKYLSSNPANSIVVCEEWSGLRTIESGYTLAR
ncbi:MAG: hypothetical protein M3Z32_03205 [Acidobacteriota bacterium]|nr:hypothetical protein [Acidobacteriota bacterium]